MSIDYRVNAPITAEQFVELLKKSTLAERRPIDDYDCMRGVVENSNLLVSAWLGDELIGVARSVTDFHYSCYLADLAVSQSVQKQGVGKILQRLTQEQLGPQCKLILLAAPAANKYYEPLGYQHNPRCWILEPDVHIEPDINIEPNINNASDQKRQKDR